MTKSEVPHDKIMLAGKNLIQKALVEMCIDGAEAVSMLGDLDGLSEDEVFERFGCITADAVALAGDWRSSPEVDVYDLALRFAEEHYRRIRQQKFPAGMYVIIMANRIEDPPTCGGQ